MNYRLATLLVRSNYDADATEIIDISVIDPISRISVILEVDSTDLPVGCINHPFATITKIELVDGSDVLYSLTGRQAHGVAFYQEKKESYSNLNYMAGMDSIVTAHLNFGRFLFDPLLAFDPKKFTNPQLKISLDIDAYLATCTDVYLTVLAHLFDEKATSPTGFIMSKEIKNYTLADSAHDYTDLPTDYAYKQLYIRAQKDDTSPTSLIDNVKISEDGDKRIPLDNSLAHIVYALETEWPNYRETIRMSGGIIVQNFFCTPCFRPRFAASGWRNIANIGPIAFYSGSGGRFTRLMDTYAGNIQAHVEGQMPQAVCPLIPYQGPEVTDVWDVTKLGSLKLDVTAGTGPDTTDTAQIIVEQLRNY